MSKVINGTKVVTNEVRLSYLNCWEPKSINGSDPKYSSSIIIAKTDTETVKAINEAIRAAYENGLAKLKGTSAKAPTLASIRSPLRDGDVERPDDPAYAGSWFLSANSKNAPQVVDLKCNRITESSDMYSGVYARVVLSFYAYNTSGNRGIAVGLGNLQKTRDGEPLGGHSRPEDEFGTETEDDFLN